MDRFKKNYIEISMFLLPALLIYTAIYVFPIFQTSYMSFMKWNGISGVPLEFVGFKNFINLFMDSTFWGSFRNMAYFMILNIVVQIPAGLALAVFLSLGLKGTKFFKAAFFMPMILSAVSISLMWRFILYPDQGLLDSALKMFGMESLIHSWLTEPNIAIFVVILIGCWQNIGVVMVLFLSGIVSIPDEIFQAANVDGASPMKILFNITIPMIWEVMKINIVLLIIGTVKVFDTVYVLTRGGPNNMTDILSTYMYKEAFENSRYGSGSAIGVMIFLLGFVLTMLANKIMHRDTLEN
jgi:raffinose/stachyose/melibiose transport system permease protein